MIYDTRRVEKNGWIAARKYDELARKYVESRDKKIVEELYELVRELQKLKNELIGLETQALRRGQNPRILAPSSFVLDYGDTRQRNRTRALPTSPSS